MRNHDFIASIIKQLKELSGERIGIITHVGGDADSLTSSLVLQNILIKRFNKKAVYIIIPDQLTELTSSLVRMLGVNVSTGLIDVDSYVALDLGSPAQLGTLRQHVHPPIILIDHHELMEEMEGWHTFTSTNYQSTAEIILEIASMLNYVLSPEEATALFIGIYFDTVRLSIADDETLRKVGMLGELHASPKNILNYLEMPVDDSERIARLKAAKRSEIYRCGELIVAISRLGAYRSSGAKALLGLGAHIAIVGDVADDTVDITIRQTPEVSDRYSLNLARDVVSPIVQLFGGDGGGHASVARIRVKGNFSDVMNKCLKQ
ncbi:MAG: DHH family phosphoesterase, partial [Nitrososphaerota archaeon]